MAGIERNIQTMQDEGTRWDPLELHDTQTVHRVSVDHAVHSAGHLTVAETVSGEGFITTSVTSGEPSMGDHPTMPGDNAVMSGGSNSRGRFNVCEDVPETTHATPHTGSYNYSGIGL